jgi:hypothetical protein
MTVRYLYQTIFYEWKFSYFVISTKEKSHQLLSLCDFSFVEMTKLNTLVLVTDSHISLLSRYPAKNEIRRNKQLLFALNAQH